MKFETERLVLRQWQDKDFAPFAAMNSNPRVMEFFPSMLTKSESDERVALCQSLIEERGWGFWALEEKESKQFIGFTGLHTPKDDLPFNPCVEIG